MLNMFCVIPVGFIYTAQIVRYKTSSTACHQAAPKSHCFFAAHVNLQAPHHHGFFNGLTNAGVAVTAYTISSRLMSL